jgi:outer membrane protein assembly factor BamE (lipoprotein component of BamABCDE complex)
MMRYGSLLVLSLSLLGGCAFVRGNYGDNLNAAEIQAIKKGVTSRSEVAAHLGAPDRITEVNGREVFHYYRYDMKSGTVLFFSRTNIKTDDLFVLFNQDGIVEDVVYGKPSEPPEFQVWPFGE